MRIVIPFALPSLNQYSNEERKHRKLGAKMKKEATDIVTLIARTKRPKKPFKQASLEFEWFVKDAKKDPDNIIFAKKFILDGLVNGGVLENDGFNNILAISDSWSIAKSDYVVVEITERQIE